MPTLKELITQIESNPKLVKLVDPKQDYIFYKFYTIYWKEENIIKSTSVCIYIDNRDTPTESVYFKDSIPEILKPQPTPPPPNPIPEAQPNIVTDINKKISEVMASDSTIEKIVISNLLSTDAAECIAYKYNSTTNTVSKMNIIMYYDKDNKVVWRKLS